MNRVDSPRRARRESGKRGLFPGKSGKTFPKFSAYFRKMCDCPTTAVFASQESRTSWIIFKEVDAGKGGTCSTVQAGIQSVSQSSSDVDTNLDPSIVMQLLDPHLRPATPDKNDPRSMALYQQHLELAEELCKVQTERALLSVKKQQLLAQQTADLQQLRETKERLLRDKQSWLQTKRYLEDLKQQKENRNQAAALAADDWVIVNGTDNR